ncbi:MAG: ABC transporter ATP-binding protein [Spirochaetales bacterium]|nr:ABC transporter ATP-binding protein [Spirochaetales bacterium]
MKLIETTNVHLFINDAPVLSDINLSLEKGEIYGILGPEKAGKTMLARLLCGLVHGKTGSVQFRGTALEQLEKSEKRKIACIPQAHAFYGDLSVKNNIRFFASLYGMKRKELREACEKTLDLCKLRSDRNRRAARLSPGKKALLNIACGLAHGPELLVIDQQTAGLLPEERQTIVSLVRNIAKKKTTLICISSLPDEIEACCNRIGILAYGRLVAEGTADELKDRVSGHSLARIWPVHMSGPSSTDIKKIEGVINVSQKMDHVQVEFRKGFSCIENIVECFSRKKNSILKIETDTIELDQVYEALLGESIRGIQTKYE